jgi:hypothetical protein
MTRRILTDEQIEELRKLYSSGEYSEQDLAQKYNCSKMTISLWKDVDDTRRKIKFTRVQYETPTFNPDLLQMVRELKEQGFHTGDIAEHLILDLEEVNKMFLFLNGIIMRN